MLTHLVTFLLVARSEIFRKPLICFEPSYSIKGFFSFPGKCSVPIFSEMCDYHLVINKMQKHGFQISVRFFNILEKM